MARKTITINDNSDKRVQTEFNLNPTNLSPAVNSGGRYNVTVQDTPKTNSALQLASNLKASSQLYNQAVDFRQKQAADDVLTMSDEDYNQFLEDGLDKETKGIFGYTKAYNRALAQKYYAEEIPLKLQSVSAEMFNNYYDYTDPEAFSKALNEKTSAVYDEADELLSGNVFGNEANRVLKNATQNDFVQKETAKFLRALPERNKEMARQTIDRAVANIDDAQITKGLFFSSLGEIYDSNVDVLGPKATSDAIFARVSNKLDTLITSNSTADHELAREMLDFIGNGKSEGDISKKIGGQDIFNTSSRELTLQQLETKLENKKDTELEDAKDAVAPRVFEQQSKAISLLASGTPEKEVQQSIQDRILYLNSPEGKTEFPNDIERNLEVISLREIYNNTKLFKNEYINNYQQSNRNPVLYKLELDSLDDAIPSEFMQANPLSPSSASEPIGIGQDYMTDAVIKIDSLYIEAAKEVSSIEDSTAKLQRFKELEQEIPDKMDAWKNKWWSSKSTVVSKVQEDASLLEEAKKVDPESAKEFEDNPVALRAIVDDKKQEVKGKALNRDEKPVGLFFKTRLNNFGTATVTGSFSSPEKQASAHADIFEDYPFEHHLFQIFKVKTPRMSNVYSLGAPMYFEQPAAEKFEAGKKVASQIRVVGLDSSVLLDGQFAPVRSSYGEPRAITVQEFLDVTNLNFSEFPIVVDGNIQTTIDTVKAFTNAPDDFYAGDFQLIANKYGLTLKELMELQRSYFQKTKYIEE